MRAASERGSAISMLFCDVVQRDGMASTVMMAGQGDGDALCGKAAKTGTLGGNGRSLCPAHKCRASTFFLFFIYLSRGV